MEEEDAAAGSEEYELVPYQEISELKEQLKHLKEVPIPTTKKLQFGMDELAMKIDRLTAIFEEAGHQIKAEEGGLSFNEKMKPLVEKMNKILEQNSEIAKGIVALADLINEQKGTSPAPELPAEETIGPAPTFPKPVPRGGMISPPPRMPQFGPPPRPGPGLPPPPAPPRKRKFF